MSKRDREGYLKKRLKIVVGRRSRTGEGPVMVSGKENLTRLLKCGGEMGLKKEAVSRWDHGRISNPEQGVGEGQKAELPATICGVGFGKGGLRKGHCRKEGGKGT